MKKLITFSFIAAMLSVIVSCSSSSNNTPTGVVKAFVECMQSGNYDSMSELLYSDGSEEAEQMNAAIVSLIKDKGAKTIEECGGIKSYEITGEEISEDGQSAEVAVNIVYGDGNSKADTYDTIMKDGKWYLEISK